MGLNGVDLLVCLKSKEFLYRYTFLILVKSTNYMYQFEYSVLILYLLG